MAERFGVEGRGAFYDEVGAIRDVVQNHMLQVVANLAMEPPVGAGHEALRDERVRVLRAIRPLTRATVVRGQYAGYRREPGVAADSQGRDLRGDAPRDRFVALGGRAVPHPRRQASSGHGDRGARRAAPSAAGDLRPPVAPNYFRFRLGPERTAIALGARTKKPGAAMVGADVELFMYHDKGDEMQPYERLLGDALRGDATLFTRQDAVEAAWRIVDPVLDRGPPPRIYRGGTWGPVEAQAVAGRAGWYNPRPSPGGDH